jgi:chlorite dismutase
MQFHHFIFLDLAKEFYALEGKVQIKYKNELQRIISKNTKVTIIPYVTIGMKVNTTCMFWIQSDLVEDMQSFLMEMRKSPIGQYFSITYTFFGAQRQSIYTNKQTAQEQAITETEKPPYFILYPFTKTKEWHFLSAQTRRALMNEHIRVGHTFPQIRQNLLYSYGLDDQEFLVSYETEKLEDFQSLVMELRSDEARRYTQSDTPIFTCVYTPVEKLMEIL